MDSYNKTEGPQLHSGSYLHPSTIQLQEFPSPSPLQLTIKCKLQPLKKERKVSDEAVFKPLHSPGVKLGNID